VPKASDIEAWSKCFTRCQFDDALGWEWAINTLSQLLR